MVDLVVDPGTVYEVPPEGLTVDNLVVHGELICDSSELVVNNRADIYGTLRVINGSRFSTAYIYSENAVFQFLDSILEGWQISPQTQLHSIQCEARRSTFYSCLFFTNGASNVTIEDCIFYKDSTNGGSSAALGNSNSDTSRITGENWYIANNRIIVNDRSRGHALVINGVKNIIIEDNIVEIDRRHRFQVALWLEDVQTANIRRNKIYYGVYGGFLFIRGNNSDIVFEIGQNANIINKDIQTKNPAYDRIIYVYVNEQNIALTQEDVPNAGIIQFQNCRNVHVFDLGGQDLRMLGGWSIYDSIFENIVCYNFWGRFWQRCTVKNIQSKIFTTWHSKSNIFEDITTNYLMIRSPNNEFRNIKLIGSPPPMIPQVKASIYVRPEGTNNRIINPDFTLSEAELHYLNVEGNPENYLINPVGLDLGKVSTSSTSYLYVYNTLDVSTRNPDGTPLPNVPVVILDDSGEVVYQGVTDAAGTLPRQELLYAVHNSGSYTLKGPYTIRAEV